MPESMYNLTIALNVLNFLGPNLYSNFPAVLSELVANAWDADATEVIITVDMENDRLIIRDNGMGMSIDDMNSKYLRVGYQKRSNEGNDLTPKGRHYMGRKGIGKLAIFSFAESMEIQSCKNGEKAGCIMHWDEISKEIEKNSYIYTPVPIPNEELTVEVGTEITLTKLYRDKLTSALPTLRKSLARRFTVLTGQHDFEVIYGGKPISDEDRAFYNNVEFIWCLGSDSKRYADKCKNVLRTEVVPADVRVGERYFKASGWVATVAKPSDIKTDQNNNSIALFAHGKLIQEDILADFQEAQAFAEYVVGDINVDFMDSDDEEDIVTADRQRVNQNDPRYHAIKKYIKEKILSQISSYWDLWRLERNAVTAFQIPSVNNWYDKLNKTNQRKAARLFAKINGLTIVDQQEKQALYTVSVEMFDSLKNIRGIPSMDETVFVELLRSTHSGKSKPYEKSTETAKTSVESPNTDTSTDPPEDSIGSIGEDSARDQNEGSTSTEEDFSAVHDSEKAESEDVGYKKSSSPPRESDEIFRNIRHAIRSSSIEQEFKTVALSDLKEAQNVYRNEGYKACVVMLGAVVEGLMLAVLRKPEVLDELRNNKKYAGKVTVTGSIGHPDYTDNGKLADAIADDLTFNTYRQLIVSLIPEIESQRVEDIQHFRNAIHPWKVIKEPHIYGNYDFNRSMSHLAALQIIANQILSWQP